MVASDGGIGITIIAIGPMGDVATDTYMTQYMPLATAIMNHWGLGADQLKKYNIEGALLKHQNFANDLGKYKDLLEKSRSDPGAQAQLPASRAQALKSGVDFGKVAPDLEAQIGKLAPALGDAARGANVSDQAKQDVVAMLTFLKTLEQAVVAWNAQPGAGFVEEILKRIEGEVPPEVYGRQK